MYYLLCFFLISRKLFQSNWLLSIIYRLLSIIYRLLSIIYRLQKVKIFLIYKASSKKSWERIFFWFLIPKILTQYTNRRIIKPRKKEHQLVRISIDRIFIFVITRKFWLTRLIIKQFLKSWPIYLLRVYAMTIRKIPHCLSILL